MAERHDAIVIGAGHNGLVCAAYLARSGWKVLVLEAGALPGGAAATREFHPGYSASTCAQFLYQFHPGVISELDLARHGLQMAAANVGTVALSPDGGHLVMDGAGAAGSDLSAGDRAAYAAFMNRMRRFAGVLGAACTRLPPRLPITNLKDLMTLLQLYLAARRLGRDDMRELLRAGAMNIYDLLDEELQSDLLRGALCLDAVLGTHLGPRSPGTVFTFLHRLVGQAWGTGMGIPRGGMGAVGTALAGAARAAGAEIRTGQLVQRIIVQDGRAAGVQLNGGATIACAVVASSADPKRTLLDLVGARNLDTGFARRVHHIRSNGTAARLHLALSTLPEFRGLDPRQLGQRLLIAPSPDYVERAFNHCKYGEYSAAPALEIAIPTFHDAALAPAGQHVLSATIQYAPYTLRAGWEGARVKFTDLVIAKLEEFAPGLRHLVVASELLTPVDIEREFRISGGHWHHGELALDRFMMLRPVPGAARYGTPVTGLYLCGAGAHPGGGVMGLAGRNAAGQIARLEGTP